MSLDTLKHQLKLILQLSWVFLLFTFFIFWGKTDPCGGGGIQVTSDQKTFHTRFFNYQISIYAKEFEANASIIVSPRLFSTKLILLPWT